MIVVDASVALEVLLQTPVGKAVEPRIVQRAETLHAPHLIDVEIAQVLRRYAAQGAITAPRCQEALDDWRAFRVYRYTHEPFLRRIWELRDNVTAYDAMYIALAEALDAPLITCDARLAQTPIHSAKIEVI